MNPPVLIHVGLHKTGSTWLQEVLFATPAYGFTRVWAGVLPPERMPPRRARFLIDEAFMGATPYDFDAARARELLQPLADEAARTGTVLTISQERLSGYPLMSRWDEIPIAERLQAAFPDARVLLVIREQRSMMGSLYKQYIHNGGTLPVTGLWRDYDVEELRRPVPVLETFEFHHLIATYQKLFESVLVLPFELLRDDPTGFAGRICSFAGRTAPSEIASDTRRAGLPGALLGPVRFSNKVLRAFGQSDHFDDRIRNGGFRQRRIRFLDRVSARVPTRMSRRADARLRDAVAAIAAGRFVRSNEIAAELTGLDLRALGYEMPDAPPKP